MQLWGNVHFYYGKTEFRSNQAFIYDTQKIARLLGNVQVSNDTVQVYADSVSYYRIANLMNMGGRVEIREKKKDGTFSQFNSRYGSYNRTNGNITAWDAVTAHSQKEKSRAACGYAFYDRKQGYGYLLQKPRLWSEGRDTLYIEAEKMEFFDADRKIVATFNVLAQSREYRATSDFLIYFLKEEKAVFVGEPQFTSDFAHADAVEFYLYFKDRALQSTELKDSCQVWFAEERHKPQTNWVKADFIRMNFHEDDLTDFTAENRVTYYYRQDKEEKKDLFVNDASGEYLKALFGEDGKLSKMKMQRQVKGIYRFQKE